MKKIIPLIIILIFFFLVYNSGTEYYKKSKEFHSKYFSGEIEKIIEGRGTKIYYDSVNYFYEGDYDGIKLMVGDIIRKNGSEITIRRKDRNGNYAEIAKGKSIEPAKSYFHYFFGI